MAGGEIDEIGRNEEGGKSARPALVQGERALGDTGEPANARADHHPAAFAILGPLGLPAGIGDRLLGGGQRKDDELVHLALFLGRNPVIDVERARGRIAARHLSGDLRRQVGDIEALDGANARLSLDQPPPDGLNPDAQRRDQTETGDNDPSHD